MSYSGVGVLTLLQCISYLFFFARMGFFRSLYWHIFDIAGTLQELFNATFKSLTVAVNMESAIAQEVQILIASDKVVIFSKTNCPFCDLAKEVFDKLNQRYTSVELDERQDGEQIQQVLGEITGARTVPRVFIKGKFLGGSSDVEDLYEKGQLQRKLIN